MHGQQNIKNTEFWL